MKRDISLIIAAAGASRRMGGSIPKQYMTVDGLPVLIKSAKAFLGVPELLEIVACVPAGDEEYAAGLFREQLGMEEVAPPAAGAPGGRGGEDPGARVEAEPGLPALKIVPGGAERQDSVAAALAACSPESSFVLVHDGARPFVSRATVDGVIEALRGGAEAAVPCVVPKSTIRTAERTLDRSQLREVQTPQGFRRGVLEEAFRKAAEDGFRGTDEAGLAERAGARVEMVQGDYANIKITTAEDLPEMIRIGNGYDVHRLVPGRKLMLGCVEVPYEKGLLGHSDADVICHAAADALLGAAALGDIGKVFPENAAWTEGMSGAEILKRTASLLQEKGFTIGNLDAILIAEKPKISPFTELMRERMAEALGVPKSCVSVKATTEERLGFTGDGSGMAAHAVALIRGR